MKYRVLSLSLLALSAACGPSQEAADPSNAAATSTAAATSAPTASAVDTAAPTASAAAKPPEMSAEDKKKAQDAKDLADDRAKMEADFKAEEARLTAALRAEGKSVAEAKYATLDAALGAALKAKYRKPGNVDRDKQRHPLETLKFLGLKPTMTVLEYGPGEGWYTELLAPTLASKGKLFITMTDPKGPADARSTFYGERTKRSLEMFTEIFGKVQPIVIDSKAPKFGLKEQVDMVLVFRAMHGLHRDKLLPALLAEVHAALKPNGVLGVEQHRANAGANPDDTAKKGYLPEEFVIKEVEAAGFKLAGKSEVNANPKDTKDYEEGVWTLPPTFRLKDKDREKYAAIGESDRMTLKFTKVAAKK